MKISPLSSLRILLASLLLASPAFPGVVHARIGGELEVGYTDYRSTLNGSAYDASSLYQRYALFTTGGGRFAKGKLGTYQYVVGYEWAAVDTTLNNGSGDQKTSIKAGHLLYQGEVDLQTRELPIRFKAYSRDLTRAMFQTDATFQPPSSDYIIDPNVVDSIIDGTHTSSGATLTFGVHGDKVPSKSALAFRELPRIYLDYRNDYVSDLKSLTPRHSQTNSFTAAINKYEGWLIYRYLNYTDFIGDVTTAIPEKREEQVFQVGMVDIRKNRRWTDLTNWISISADGQATKVREQTSSDTYREDVLDLNLFVAAERPTWSLRNFNTFTRTLHVSETENSYITHESFIPVYLKGTLGPDTDWQARVSVRDRILESGQATNDILATARLETFKRSLFTLTPSLTAQRFTSPDETTITLQGTLEAASTRRYSSTVGLFASYDIKNIRSETPAVKTDRLEQTLTGRINYTATDRVRLNFEEKLVSALGGDASTSSSLQGSGTNSLLSNSSSLGESTRDQNSTDYIQSTTTAGASWEPVARMRVGAQASLDIFQQNGGDLDTVMTLTNTIDYTMPSYAIKGSNRFSKRIVGDKESSETNSSFNASYNPNRNTEMLIRGTYNRLDDFGAITNSAELLQRIRYTIQGTGFGQSKLLDLIEEAGYNTSDKQIYSGLYSTKRHLTLIAKSYPLRNLYVGATARYSLLDPGSVSEWLGSATVGLSFRKLQVALEAAYGRRNGSSDNRIEKRVSANLKKQF
ncbi:MAG: hypothetical protein HZC44_12600 [Geobacter sp.]|nr:hypothetical protein [Geobacter sp.]